MNFKEAPPDDAEVQQLMRESDTLGSDHALFLRAWRQLTKEGKLIGELHGISIPTAEGKNMLLGMFTLTDDQRFVFWPVLPRGKAVIIDRPNTPVPDHITVQFPSEKVHVTWYEPSGTADHHRDAWRSQPFECPRRNLLFMFLVRMSVVADQDILVSRKFPVPKSDNDRRTAEFEWAAKNYRHHHLPIPGDASQADYACIAVYRTFEFMTPDSLPQSLLPGSEIRPAVDGWLEDGHYRFMTNQVQLGEFKFCFAAGFPPGRLRGVLQFGFPRRTKPIVG